MPEDNAELTPPVFLRFRDTVVRVDRGFAGSWYLVKEDWLYEETESTSEDGVSEGHAPGGTGSDGRPVGGQ